MPCPGFFQGNIIFGASEFPMMPKDRKKYKYTLHFKLFHSEQSPSDNISQVGRESTENPGRNSSLSKIPYC